MKKEKLEVVRGSGNVFRDLKHKNADAEQFKAILAAEIIKAVDRERLTVRAAHRRTGIAAADFPVSATRTLPVSRLTVLCQFSIDSERESRSRFECAGNERPDEASRPACCSLAGAWACS